VPFITGQSIINQALTTLNILDAGGAPSASESADLLIELNQMVDAWNADNTLVYGTLEQGGPLVANQGSYRIGPDAVRFPSMRPSHIANAWVTLVIGTSFVRRPLRIVGQETYYGHADLSTANNCPEEIYYDCGILSGDATIFFYPVPLCTVDTRFDMQVWAQLAAFALGASVFLPPAYQDALVQALAFRCLPRYGAVVNQETAQVVTSLGVTAKDRVKALNVLNRVLDPALAPPTENQQRMAAQQQQAPQR
jgi:hypothetical protein